MDRLCNTGALYPLLAPSSIMRLITQGPSNFQSNLNLFHYIGHGNSLILINCNTFIFLAKLENTKFFYDYVVCSGCEQINILIL